MPRYGIIDIGSNTVRLVIYDTSAGKRGGTFARNLKPIANSKTVAGLAAYVKNGQLSEAGIERASQAVAEHLEQANLFDCKNVSAFATAVLRNAENGRSAVRTIEQRSGVAIELLSGEEEARLGFVGASIGQVFSDGVLIDIGGGSTEISLIEDGGVVRSTSIRQGALTLYERFVSEVLPTPDEVEAMKAEFSRLLAADEHLGTFEAQQAYGIGGSIRAAAKLIGANKRPKSFPADSLNSMLADLAANRSAFAHRAARATPERMHTAVPGCVILHAIVEKLGIDTVSVCKYGLREGYLVECAMRKTR